MKSLSEILTPRELDFARYVHACYSNREIAAKFGVSLNYVKLKLGQAYIKIGMQESTGMTTRVALALRVERELQQKILAPDPSVC